MARKGGFPGGMPGNMNNLMKQAQRMQRQMEETTKELEQKEYTATAGGGAVEVVVSGKKELISVKLAEEVVDPEDIEMLQDLIVAATNESLEEKVRDGSFRRDLYYRLNTLQVLIPPLCRRGEDVFLLMERFCRELKGEFVLSEEVKKIFRTYSWPGNIRELRNLAEYFCFTGSQVITVKDLPPTFQYDGIGTGLSYCVSKKAEYPEPVLQPDTAPWKQAMREQGLEPEEYWFVLKMLYCSSENGETVGRERILEAARKEKLA